MEIRHSVVKKKGSFVIDDNGKSVGKLDYLISAPDEITLYHTEVDEKFRGEGLGNDLVEAAVKHARQKDLKVIAKCPFARKVIEGAAEMKDVLAGQE
jgi:predicted GNAT family acetyltransferase